MITASDVAVEFVSMVRTYTAVCQPQVIVASNANPYTCVRLYFVVCILSGLHGEHAMSDLDPLALPL